MSERTCLLAIVSALTLALIIPAKANPVANMLPDQAEIDAVKARLAPIQLLSFATGREYCGYLGELANERLFFTEMIRGGHDGCTPRLPRRAAQVRASLHTHGAYDPSVPAEFPTVLDMDSDAREGVNGYVATPGGRLWYINSRALVAIQICGEGCLPQDERFRTGDDGPIRNRYTREELLQLEKAH
ncbi:DUF4329 domain-containing protein [Pontibaca salina]|uniref:DUF4329 domain-containing protein n=1 Tax=Pontibaca salina TaxID=2795731 RepID=A0A934HI47_9RHOB|nr:DUF4329 domain-containing protein [Pontibaca salina]MBI6628593.1 DUF4329 domain-containing protein [Pontibaca salina]